MRVPYSTPILVARLLSELPLSLLAGDSTVAQTVSLNDFVASTTSGKNAQFWQKVVNDCIDNTIQKMYVLVRFSKTKRFVNFAAAANSVVPTITDKKLFPLLCFDKSFP